MSLSTTSNRVDYVGNGAVDTYAYTFRIIEDSDLIVSVRDTNDVETTLTLTTHYTVTGAGESSGGNIALVNGSFGWLDGDGDLKSGYALSIQRIRPITQTTDIRNQGEFYPESIEDEFDHQIMIAQQQKEEIDRCVQLPNTLSSDDFDPGLPSALASSPGATIIVNDAGDGFSIGPTASAIGSAEDIAEAAITALGTSDLPFAQNKGPVLKTPDGAHTWRVVVDNSGNIGTVQVS